MFTNKTAAVLAIIYFSINLLAAISPPIGCQEISTIAGRTIDAQTGESIGGVLIRLTEIDAVAISDSLGNFQFRGISPGDSKLTASILGYEVAVINPKTKDLTSLVIKMTPTILRGQDIIVTANRASEGETPAAFSNISSAEIEKSYWSQDTPVLLANLPNSYAYSDAGSGIGYSYLKIRGFDQKRISVMLNGVPLNDAESHEVFWVDLPDFVASTSDIQVQRGVGLSIYGTAALGGSVNLVTSNFAIKPDISIESAYGSYDTRKFSIEGHSGLINDQYSFYGRYSKIETAGYRRNSWTNMYAYFFGLNRVDENMTWEFNTYGGPEESHLAYKGITQEQLENDRRFNELQFEGEIDHFNQPHYELLNDLKISENLGLANTLYYFSGDGYYNQLRTRRDIEEYFPGHSGLIVSDTLLAPRDYYDLNDDGTLAIDDSGNYAIVKTDIIRRPTVVESDWGWIPRFDYNHSNGKLTVGAELRSHKGHHYGEVVWAANYPVDLPANIKYYDYRTRSLTYSVYFMENYKITERLILMANLQYQRHSYELKNESRFDVAFDRHFDYFSPRAGLHFAAASNINLFANISSASRHPAFKDIYDPTDYWSNPNYKPDNFISNGMGWSYIGKEIKPEKVLDFELGGDINWSNDLITLDAAVNLYRLEMKDEILPYAGQIDDMGYPISGNADKTIHQGVEISANANLRHNLSLIGNVAVNDDHFEKYIEYGFDYDNWVPLEFDRSGNRIGGFPQFLANYRIEWSKSNMAVGLSGRFAGRQYIDNAETFKLDSHNIFDFDLSFDFGKWLHLKGLKSTLRINNITGRKYVAAGYIEPDDNLPRYLVGAERGFYFSVKASL